MSVELEKLNQFIAKWRASLEAQAKLTFLCAEIEESFDPPQVIADRFVRSRGFKPIGHNWELLDAAPDASGGRSAAEIIADALAKDMVFGKEWLGSKPAMECANEFLSAFTPERRTILSNRYDGLWNPITNAQIEYAFVGFDDRKIALLVVSVED